MIDSERLIESVDRISSALNNIAAALYSKNKIKYEVEQYGSSASETQDEDLSNPEELELDEVHCHLQTTRYQLQKMTDLVELLVKQIVTLTTSKTK